MLFPSIKKGKHVILNLCSNPFHFEKRIIPKSSGNKMMYKYARKIKWGSLWPYELDDKKFRKKKHKKLIIDTNILPNNEININ